MLNVRWSLTLPTILKWIKRQDDYLRISYWKSWLHPSSRILKSCCAHTCDLCETFQIWKCKKQAHTNFFLAAHHFRFFFLQIRIICKTWNLRRSTYYTIFTGVTNKNRGVKSRYLICSDQIRSPSISITFTHIQHLLCLRENQK